MDQTTASVSGLSISEESVDQSVTSEDGVKSAADKSSLKEEKKAAKTAEKAAKQAAKEKARLQQLQQAERQIIMIKEGGIDLPDGSFGDYITVQSAFNDSRTMTPLSQLTSDFVGQHIWTRARIHTVRAKGKFAFIVLRRGYYSVQAVIVDGEKQMTKDATKWAGKLPCETIVDVYGEVAAAEVKGCSQSQIEIKVAKIFVVSLSSNQLPFQIEDASRAEAKNDVNSTSSSDVQVISVGTDVRLDNRWIDMRTPANHAIFILQSKICQYYRDFFLSKGFVEIHSPKLTPGVSEGGAAVFRLRYFNEDACLAQSPQLYKQMAVQGDLFNVFEIGPVFRAEDSNTHRHLTEFVGMDFEMEIQNHYHEVLKVLGDLFVHIFDQLSQHCQTELQAVNEQYPFQPLLYHRDTKVIPFKEAVAMLRTLPEFASINDFDDLSTPAEKALGKLVRQKFNTDFYIVDKYPLTARPFYTMPCPHDPRYTNSYDVFLRGEEITSGAQRIHDTALLIKRAVECNIPLSNIASYVESFKYGAWPHGGAGIGLERVVMLFLGLDNIRKTSMFPRAPNRIAP